mgnify:CR=1 FL=1
MGFQSCCGIAEGQRTHAADPEPSAFDTPNKETQKGKQSVGEAYIRISSGFIILNRSRVSHAEVQLWLSWRWLLSTKRYEVTAVLWATQLVLPGNWFLVDWCLFITQKRAKGGQKHKVQNGPAPHHKCKKQKSLGSRRVLAGFSFGSRLLLVSPLFLPIIRGL